MNKKIVAVVTTVVLLFTVFAAPLTACAQQEGFALFSGEPEYSNPDYIRPKPEVKMSGQTGAKQETLTDELGQSAVIDSSNVAQGYVTAKCHFFVEAKFRIEKRINDEETEIMNFDIPNDGVFTVYPITMGNGNYTFSIYYHLEGDKFASFLAVEEKVVLESAFAPFEVPNQSVNYTPDSNVVDFSWEISQHASTDLEIVQQVYYWVQNNIAYDNDRAEWVRAGYGQGYLPDVDKTLMEKKGICYDYAALVAAMLRINAIPCQLIVGYVSMDNGGNVYHAWNMIWLDDVGWIAVQVPSTPEEWERLDLTFAAAKGSDVEEFIGNAENYLSVYVY